MNLTVLTSLCANLLGQEAVARSLSVQAKILHRLDRFRFQTPSLRSPPPARTWLYVVSMLTVLVGFVLLSLSALWAFRPLQEFFWRPDGLWFVYEGPYLLMITWIFLSPVLLSLLLYILFYLIEPWRISYFVHHLRAERKYIRQPISFAQAVAEYDIAAYARSLVRRFVLLCAVVCVLTLPFQVLALRSHVQVTQERIDVANVFSIFPSTYSWEQVLSYALRVREQNGHLDPQLLLVFDDGREVDVWDIAVPVTPTRDVLALIDLLESHGVLGLREPLPSLNKLRSASREQIETVFAYRSSSTLRRYIPDGSLLEQFFD